MTPESTFGGYPVSCLREGLFQLEGEQVRAIVNDLLDALSESVHRWIPASERLPQAQTCVLAVVRQHTFPFVPVVAYYTTQGGQHMLATTWIDSAGEYIDVTHWMPLPEAPK